MKNNSRNNIVFAILGSFASFLVMLTAMLSDNSSTQRRLDAGTFHSDCKDLFTPLQAEFMWEYALYAVLASIIVIIVATLLYAVLMYLKKKVWTKQLLFFTLGFILSLVLYVPLFAAYVVKTDQLAHKATFEYCTREYWRFNI